MVRTFPVTVDVLTARVQGTTALARQLAVIVFPRPLRASASKQFGANVCI